MESALRPRDIQARIRGGESAEEVAAAAQTTVDAIMGFAAPVLAERAHVAQSAQKSSIRRRSTETSTAAGTLDQAARGHLSTVGVRADEVEWDAWRREDGRWTLVAQYAVSGTPRRAEFTYDQPGRYVVADNQEARLLTGEAVSTPAGGAAPARRLSSVPSSSADDELPLGDDAIELVRDRAQSSDTAPEPASDPGLDEPMLEDRGDADWIAEPTDDTGPLERLVDGAAPVDEPTAPAEVPEVADDADSSAPAEDTRPVKPHKKGRSSVPSWDEIMFGGGKGE